MTDRGIIFSAPMVKALLAGRKVMTRRLAWQERHLVRADGSIDKTIPICPWPSLWQKVKPGDRLWVRESARWSAEHGNWYFMADSRGIGLPPSGVAFPKQKAIPSIHLPRWASRLTLMVTATKVEPLHAITDADAIAEGIAPLPLQDAADPSAWWESGLGENQARSPRESFRKLWNSLHGTDAWDANPGLVAISFAVERRNIDQERSIEA